MGIGSLGEELRGGDCLQHGILVHPLLGSSMGSSMNFTRSTHSSGPAMNCISGGTVRRPFFRTAARRKEHRVFSGMWQVGQKRPLLVQSIKSTSSGPGLY